MRYFESALKGRVAHLEGANAALSERFEELESENATLTDRIGELEAAVFGVLAGDDDDEGGQHDAAEDALRQGAEEATAGVMWTTSACTTFTATATLVAMVKEEKRLHPHPLEDAICRTPYDNIIDSHLLDGNASV